MIRRASRLAVVSAALAGSLTLALALAGPAAAVDYPSWDDVLAARQSQAETQAAIDQIEGLLVSLEAKSEELGRTAQVKGEQYNSARSLLDAASTKADKLQQQAADAAATATVSARRAGQLVAQLARAGAGSLTLELLLSPSADDLLGTLGTASKVTEQAADVYNRAIQDKNNAQALTDQAKIAEDERTALAATAEDALAQARAAADAAVARVDEQKAASDQMYAQLASLKGTTSDVEAGYVAGLTAAQEQAQQPAPPVPTGPAPNPPPPAPNSSAVAGAIAFAYAQIGDMYQFAGSGPDVWDCSGLTQAAYASVGVYVGAHIVSSQYYTMANAGRLVPIDQMVAGDLIYYADGGVPWGGFYHMAMYVGGGQMIEAPREGVPVRVTGVRYYDALPYAGRPTP